MKGRDLIAGAPKTIEVNSEEIRDALAEPVSAVIDAIKTALERTPPELAGRYRRQRNYSRWRRLTSRKP